MSADFIHEQTNLQIKPPKTANGELYCFYIRTEKTFEEDVSPKNKKSLQQRTRETITTYKSIRAPFSVNRESCDRSDRSMIIDSNLI
jgi:hypothetical protein